MSRYPFLVVLLLVGGALVTFGSALSAWLWPIAPIVSILTLVVFIGMFGAWMSSLLPWVVALVHRLPWDTVTQPYSFVSAQNPRESYLFNAILNADRYSEESWSAVHESTFVKEVHFLRSRGIPASEMAEWVDAAKSFGHSLGRSITDIALLGGALRARHTSGLTTAECLRIFEEHGFPLGITMLENDVPAEYAYAL